MFRLIVVTWCVGVGVVAGLMPFLRLQETERRVVNAPITDYNQLWPPALEIARALRLAKPRFGSTWFSPHDMRNAAHAIGIEVIQKSGEIV